MPVNLMPPDDPHADRMAELDAMLAARVRAKRQAKAISPNTRAERLRQQIDEDARMYRMLLAGVTRERDEARAERDALLKSQEANT